MKLQVRAGRRVDEDLRSIAQYLRREAGEAIATRIVNELIDEMVELGARQIGRRTDDALPPEYRRRLVGNYIIFYLIDEPTHTLFVHEVRHAARRPLQPRTHKQRAAQAERDSQPLRHPRPTDN